MSNLSAVPEVFAVRYTATRPQVVVRNSHDSAKLAAIAEIVYNVFYIGTTIAKPFAGPFIFLVKAIQLTGAGVYYAVTVPDFVEKCVEKVQDFRKSGPKVPVKVQLNNFLRSINVFGPNKLKAIQNIAIFTLKALSWSMFIASFFVMPHVAFILCLAASTIALSLSVKDLYFKYRAKTEEIPLLSKYPTYMANIL